MYQVSIEQHFDAAHFLRGYQGKCEAILTPPISCGDIRVSVRHCTGIVSGLWSR